MFVNQTKMDPYKCTRLEYSHAPQNSLWDTIDMGPSARVLGGCHIGLCTSPGWMSRWIENLSLDLGDEHDNNQLPRHRYSLRSHDKNRKVSCSLGRAPQEGGVIWERPDLARHSD